MLLKLNLQRFVSSPSSFGIVTSDGIQVCYIGSDGDSTLSFSGKVLTITAKGDFLMHVNTANSTYVESYTTDYAKTLTITMKQEIASLSTTTADSSNNITITFATGETWVLNETYTEGGSGSYNINFTSNGETFGQFSYGDMPRWYIKYGETNAYFNGTWSNVAYRTINFTTPPTGDLLTWLQANGTKQETSAHKLTFDSNITITVNGSSVTTSPYNLTNGDVITATTGGGYKISINGTLYGGTSTININNQDINIVRSTAETFDTLLVTINYTETSTPTYSFKHWKKSNVKINEQSTETWLFNSPMTDTSTNKEINITFTSNGETFTKLAIRLNKGIMNYVKSDGTSVGAYEDGWAGNPQYQTITVDTRQANYQELRTFLNSNASIQSSNKYYFKPYTILELWRIDTTLTNCSGATANATKIEENGGLTLTFTANSGYELPTGVSVTNVTSYNWNKSTGILAISKPTGDVTIEIVAVSALPQLSTPTNVAVTDTTLTFDEVANATSYEVFVDNVSIGTHTIASGETWLLNSLLVFGNKNWSYNINFTSNGNSYSKFSYDFIDPIEGSNLVYGTTNVYNTNTLWTNEAYRTVIFEKAPTGDLLTWLQKNGTKQ